MSYLKLIFYNVLRAKTFTAPPHPNFFLTLISLTVSPPAPPPRPPLPPPSNPTPPRMRGVGAGAPGGGAVHLGGRRGVAVGAPGRRLLPGRRPPRGRRGADPHRPHAGAPAAAAPGAPERGTAPLPERAAPVGRLILHRRCRLGAPLLGSMQPVGTRWYEPAAPITQADPHFGGPMVSTSGGAKGSRRTHRVDIDICIPPGPVGALPRRTLSCGSTSACGHPPSHNPHCDQIPSPRGGWAIFPIGGKIPEPWTPLVIPTPPER